MMADGQAFDDIMNALYVLRAAFIKNGMKPPISIELGDRKDGDFFRYTLPREMAMMHPRMGDTKQDAEWVCNIMGVEVRMPGQWRYGPDGKIHFI